jgi:DNA-binding response OmpR family regulator
MAKSILCVDDDLAILEFLKDILGSEGYDIYVAPSGEQGLELARLRKPDLVILDVMMPGMDGFKVGYKLKTNPETENISIIYLTVMDDRESKDKAENIGAKDYLTKPFDPKNLIESIYKVIGA